METIFTKDMLLETLRDIYRAEESRSCLDGVNVAYWWRQRRKRLDALELAINAQMEGRILP